MFQKIFNLIFKLKQQHYLINQKLKLVFEEHNVKYI